MSTVWQPHDVYTEDRRQALENQQPLSAKLTVIFWTLCLLASLGMWAGLYYGGFAIYRMIK